jgi:hypothetical protein
MGIVCSFSYELLGRACIQIYVSGMLNLVGKSQEFFVGLFNPEWYVAVGLGFKVNCLRKLIIQGRVRPKRPDFSPHYSNIWPYLSNMFQTRSVACCPFISQLKQPMRSSPSHNTRRAHTPRLLPLVRCWSPPPPPVVVTLSIDPLPSSVPLPPLLPPPPSPPMQSWTTETLPSP